jgi:hypothetical protein
VDERARRETDGKPYEPPALVWLGTLQTVTAVFPGVGPDGGIVPGVNKSSPSDRALKERFGLVDPAEILAGVLALPIYRRD